MRILMLAAILGLSGVDRVQAAPAFGPLLGTPQQGLVEMAVMGLSGTEPYREALAAGERHHAVMMIIVQIVAHLEADREKRRAHVEDGMTAEQRRFMADRDDIIRVFSHHSGENWEFWLGTAAVAYLVESGEIAGYPNTAMERRSREMILAFEPLMRPMDSGSVFGHRHDVEVPEDR